MTNPVTPIGTALTHMLVVKVIEPARDFYTSVLGATVYREYGGTSCVLQLHDSWLLLVTGGGPTDDKPSVSFADLVKRKTRFIQHRLEIARVCDFSHVP